MKTFPRFLAVICSILVALPPGWCCTVAEIVRVDAVANDAGHPESDHSDLGGCCCCSEDSGTCPLPRDSKQPNPPKQKPCCEQPPVTPQTMEGFPVDFPPAAILWELVPISTCEIRLPQPEAILGSSEPALHVRHCVWRC